MNCYFHFPTNWEQILKNYELYETNASVDAMLRCSTSLDSVQTCSLDEHLQQIRTLMRNFVKKVLLAFSIVLTQA